ncbi:MAG: hypothetical protein AAFX50_19005, partial [Acidobacteriota bacterium]
GADGAADFDFWESEERLMNGALLGEAMFHLMRGDLEAHRELSAEVAAHRPDFARHYPRVTRNWLDLWQRSFDEPLITDEVRATLDAEVRRLRQASRAEP